MREDGKELLAKALGELRRLKQENAALKNAAAEPIAVVGMACRFPESANPEAYWDFLASARSAIRPTPPDRAEGTSGGFGSYLDDTDLFDAAFFSISPKEAQSLDPQQRLLLELAWHAFESGNHRPDAYAGRDVGVFVGMSGIDYALKLFTPSNRDGIDPYFGTGSTLSPAAGRLSYFFKFNGPAMVVDTACSSALVAIHLAVESLRRGECEAALAAGVNRILGPDLTATFAESGLLASDGQCYTFDARAQGYSRGEGGGVLLLKRLRDAQAGGDPIFSVILGSAVNQDGGSGGLTMPSGPAQQKVIRRALQVAGLTPADVDYVEAHGTATPLGDPIEANALAEVFAPEHRGDRPLFIGSVKTNLGHLEAAAGMASSFKVIQSLRHEALPAHRNFSEPSPHIDWSRAALQVVDALKPWPRGERRRIAGVSGFGFAGTNAHVIFAEPPPIAAPIAAPVGPELLVLSARSSDALRALAGTFAPRMENLAPEAWAGAARATQSGRVPMAERLSVAANNPGEAMALLRRYAETGKARGLAVGRAGETPRVAFVFTGQGAQYAGMGKGLYAAYPLFRDIVDACAVRLQPELGRDLREVMFAASPVTPAAGTDGASVLDGLRHTAPLAEIDQTAFTQAGLFVLEYALARLWQSWGIQPQVALGHSAGEYAAACIAGVFDLEDALRLIAARGRLMEERSARGSMLTVFADEAAVAKAIAPHAATVSIAAVNGPEIVLVSGASDTIDRLQAHFAETGVRVVRMRISHAFHSPLTEPVLEEITRVAASLRLNRPTIPLISNVTGALVDEEIARPEYWARHLRQSVRFCESMTLLHAQRLDFFIEIGPEPTLLGLDLCFRAAREQSASKATWLPSLRRGHDDRRALLDSAGRLWTAGAALDWEAVNPGHPRTFVSLPSYPYQRKRHWFKSAEAPPAEAVPAAPSSVLSMPVPTQPAATIAPQRATTQEILAEVQAIIGEVSGIEPGDLPLTANLLEMGLDSLMFVRVGRTLEKRFQVKISIKQFYEDLHRLGPLVEFLAAAAPAGVLTRAAELPPAATIAPTPAAVPAVAPAIQPPIAGGLDPVWQAHFNLMERYLQSRPQGVSAPAVDTASVSRPVRANAPADSRMTGNFAGLNLEEEKNLSPQQKEFLRGLIERLVAKTRRSKEQTQAWRRTLADWKGSLQFKRSLKELKYPIVSDRAEGSRIWDLDGNEYVDLALGMGVHFLGHAPAFINAALHQQIDRSAALGPQSDLAGDVARKICELTGAERASLVITGSGAVLLAQRIARAATGRPLIAQFAGAYHGIGSEVLVVAGEDGARPLSPGIPPSVAENAVVLDYGSDESLEWIRENAGRLAAVMVEPVQSRRPGFQPHRFLRRLRRLTEELDIALIFDEMINGFRIHAGGAQAWFGIQADIVTYGKIVGGGLPLAAVAGKARFLDWIDGGFWQFGDDSTPKPYTVFTGGTHNRHPLALAAANAALDHLVVSGPALHEAVNRRTERLAKELNAFLEAEAVSFRVSWFGSQFRFEALGDSFELEVLFYVLTEMGFYTWEQRICCLSTAHTDEEIDRLIEAVKRAVAQMRAGGFALLAGAGAPRRVLPLSSVQERLFALCQREGAEMPYHLSGVWEMRGPVDPFQLQDAFQEIVRRHESLRTAFGLIAGKPCQYIIDEPRFFLETIDAAGRSPEAVLEQFIRPFDLERPPLLRVGHAPLGRDRSLLLIDVHHIAADGLSMNVILQEFAALYDGRALRPVRRQYRHAIDEAQQHRKTPEYEAQATYWMTELAGELPVLELPTDRARSGEMDFRGDKCGLTIDPERTRQLESLAREHGASLYMVLLGAFSVLLHRLTEAEDLIVGLPVAGRPGADSDDVVGMFVNSLPLRFRPCADEPFVEFLRSVRSTCLGAYDHPDYAFGELVERLNLPRNPDRNPVFDTMFAYENADERVMRTRDLEIRTIDQFEGSGMFDFNVDIIREAGALNVRFHYATRLFRRETIERWSAAYARLLDAILAGPRAPLGRLPMLSDQEREHVTASFNAASGAPAPTTTLVALWNDAARRHADRIALVGAGRRLTFREADELANAFAERLVREWGVKRGDRVALLVEASEGMMVALLGILKAGAAYVPIDPANPAERVRALVQDCEARLLVVDAMPTEWRSGVPAVEVAALTAAAPKTSGPTGSEPTASDLAYIIYTSGSTGQPKGVMIEHGAIANSIQWRLKAYPFCKDDATLLMPSYSFDASVLDLFGSVLVGGRLVFVNAAEKRDLTAQAKRLRNEGVTNLLLTPSLHALYLQEIADAMQGLRWVCVAGEATSRSLLRRHFDRLPKVRLFNEYGPTENSVVSTFTELFPDDEVVTIGRPVAGHHAYVLQRNGEFCGVGVPGELVLSGPGLARGYLNRAELTEAAFTRAPWDPTLRIYRTGDLARWRPDGTLDFLGRRDGQVKLHGYRIELEEIEELLRRQSGVSAAAVKLVAVAGEHQLVAYLAPTMCPDDATLRAACQASLPVYMTPTVFVRLPELPLNHSGKVDRRALPVPEIVPVRAAGEPPRGSREVALAEVWRDVLRHDAIGRDDDYFRLGGDSIKGIQIISRLLQRGWRLDMRWLFRHPTIAGLAPCLEETRGAAAAAPESAGDVPLGPIQRWFFETFEAQLGHFNQGVWLDARGRWQVEDMAEALRVVVAGHDAFRFRFSRDASGWRQRCVTAESGFACRMVDVRGSGDADARLVELVSGEQRGFDVEQGPLTRALIVRTDASDRLLWLAHHLVVDGVSWRILLEDLASAYAARRAGRPIPAPVRTASFGRWTRTVTSAVKAGSLRDELDYWRKLANEPAPRLPRDTGRSGTAAELRTITARANRTLTGRLLGEAQEVFGTRGSELFVAALRLAHAEWNPGEPLALLLEGHGREASLADLDVSRTVGWFTSAYPARFDALGGQAECAAVVRETKDQIRRVPRQGAGFGWLRAAGGDPVLREMRAPAIGFNYLGSFDDREAEAPFVLSAERPLGVQDPRQPAVQAVSLVGYRLDGELHWALEYDSGRWSETIARGLLERFVGALERIAARATEAPVEATTPADFAFGGLSLAAFDGLRERRGWAADAVEDVYPLSPMQRGLYYEALKSPDSEAYFEQVSFRLEGRLDVEAFRRSWQGLAERHPALRSVFVRGEGSDDVLQVVLRAAAVSCALEDISARTSEEQRARIDAFKREDRATAFVLEDGPLVRMRLFQLGGGAAEVVWSHHHILMDGWCVGILYEDLMRLYEAHAERREPKLGPPADYREYLRWLGAVDRGTTAAFWRKELEGYDRMVSLPRTQTGRAGDYRCRKGQFRLEGPDWSALRALASAQGATLATLLQTLWGVLLARYNQTEDLVFGGIVSGRPENVADVERMVGLFINALPVRLRFEQGLTLAYALSRFQQQAIERRPHEYLPLAEVAEQSGGLRELFDHLVVLENYPMDEELRGDGQGEPGDRVRPRISQIESFERTHFDFTLVAVPRPDALEVELTYNESVYSTEQIRRVQAHFVSLVAALARDPAVPCLEVEFLPIDEQRQLERWNDTAAAYPVDATIVSLFDEQVARHPRRTAVTFAGKSCTYAEIDEAARRLAVQLRAAGVRSGDRVAIWLPRDANMVTALLGTLKAGGCYVPLDPEYPEERLRFILEDSAARVVVAHTKHRSAFPALKEILIDEAAATAPSKADLPAPKPDDPAYVIYTSGSTGKPKGCLIAHRNVVRLLRNDRFDFEFGPEDVWVVAHSFCFDFSVWEVYGALLYGGRVVVAPREEVRDVRSFVDLVERERVTVLNQTPAAFYAFLDEASKRTSHDFAAHLRYVIFGGDRLEPHYLSPWAQRYGTDRPALINMYGITETTVHVTFHRVTMDEIAAADGRSVIGRPLPETQVWVFDAQRRLLPIGIAGELYVGGTGVGLGYLNRAELTAERFLPDPRGNGSRLYRTGDVGRWREDGRLEYLGRNDHQVQVRGFRVELGEIEAAFLAQGEIEQAVVLPFEPSPGQVELAAYLVGRTRGAAELRTALGARLPLYMVPGYIEWLPAIPLTANGKIDRKALPRPGGRGTDATAAPRDETERALLAMWQDVLGLETMGVNDNFFDLGGHSLKAVRLRAKIEDGFKVSVSLRDLFAHPTIAELAALMRPAEKAGAGTDEAAELAKLMDGLSPEEIEAQLNRLGN